MGNENLESKARGKKAAKGGRRAPAFMSFPKTRLTRILAPRTVAFGCVVTSDFSMFRAGSLARKYVEKLWWRIFLMVSSGACRFLLFSITYVWFRSSRCVESSLGNWSQKGAQKGGRLAGRAAYPQVHPFRPWLGRFHITHSYPEIAVRVRRGLQTMLGVVLGKWSRLLMREGSRDRHREREALRARLYVGAKAPTP